MSGAEYARVTIEDNIPVTFTPKYVDYQKSTKGFSDQIRVKSEEGQLLYLPLDLATAFVEAGLFAPSGTDKWGNPAWRVVAVALVTYTKRSKGKPPSLTVNGQPFVPSTWKEDTASTGHQKAGVATAPASSVPVASPGDQWAILEATMAKAADIALAVWADPQRIHQLTTILGVKPTFEGLVAQAATAMISADKKGMKATPPAPPVSRAELEELPKAIHDGIAEDVELMQLKGEW